MIDDVRRTLLYAVPAACLAVVVGTSIAWRDDLPDPIAIHWAFGGSADGFGPLWLTTVLFAALIVGIGFAPLVVQQRVGGPETRWLGALAAGVSGFLTVVHVGALHVNRGVTAAAEAASPDTALFLGLAVLVVLGLLGWWCSPEGEASETELPVEDVEVSPGEALVWHGTATAGAWLVVLAAGILVGGVALGLVAPVWNAALLVLAGLAVTSILRLRVTVDGSGVLVRHGPLGLIRTRVELADVTAVTAELVEPMAYGGWGYRVRPGARAIIVRRGPGLRLERDGTPALVVTVDGAGRAAGVVRALLAQRAGR